jgi:hypothetical protein
MGKSLLILLWAGLFLEGFSPESRGDVLDNWTTNQITTNSFELRHVVYGNGIYVAVGEGGDGGEIYTSADGLNWALQFSDNNSWGLTLNYSQGHFAGAGGFQIVDVSVDGTNWTSTFLPNSVDGEIGQAVTYGRPFGQGLYVTVGDTNGVGSIWTSPDDITWTLRSVTNGPGGHIQDVAFGGVTFVAIGNNDGLVYTSTGLGAGTVWARNSIAGGKKISYANGLFIVPLNSQTNLISRDGLNWSAKSTGLTNLMGKVTYGNGLFMAQCGISIAGSHLATSTDGTNWVQYVTPLPNYWSDAYDLPDPDVGLATDGTRLVAVGAARKSLFPEYDSFVWTSDALVGVRMTNSPSGAVALSGLVGRNYQIQWAETLADGSSQWVNQSALKLPFTPYVWTAPAGTNSARFYRGVLMP